jgi:hypothetical protein
MRVPTGERRRFRVRGWVIALAVAALILLFSLRGLAGFSTEYLWFDSLGQGDTWGSLLAAKVVPALVFTALFFAILFVNLVIADRLAPRFRAMSAPTPEDELVTRYQETTARYRGRIRIGIALFFALIAGIGVSSQWRQWILFTNGGDFGIKDPEFNKDVGFYVFKLPFINFIIDWLFAGLVIVLLVTAVAHYLNGGIRFQTPGQRATPQVKAHLSVILAVMALVKTAEYYFSRFELDLSDRGVVDGATYTDVKAQLPALNFLIFVSIIAALLFVWNIWRRGWVLPVIAVGLWAFVGIVVGTIYPAVIQNFKVEPNEFASERPYIRRNIRATRDAFNLADVTNRNFDFKRADPTVVQGNLTTIDNARLWDPGIIQSTYQTLQGLQTYYKVNDVDIDRYMVDGQIRQVLISARDVSSTDLPSQSWVNERLVYTHGYSAIASPSNQATDSGNPLFFLSDIPPDENGIELNGKSNEIYFGEGLNEYVIVGAKQAEFNYPREGRRNAETRYDGKDGVDLSGWLRRAAFALRFSDPNILISGQITEESKILMVRNVRDRVEELAPFLDLDADPYPAIVDGKMLWILDGYTTSSNYPYSQSVSGIGGLSGDFNYVRNSVKITVDAYEGTVKFYVIDEGDPMVQAYSSAFPDLFTPGSEMPDELREHLRYPEDLFRVQSNVYSNYHVTEPQRFYQGSERWLLSPDPNVVTSGFERTTATTRAQSSSGRSAQITASTKRQDPYYLYIRLPNDDRESFLILQPFVPVSKDNQQTRLISFMTAKSDPRDYGKLEAFVMPQGRTVTGPVQVANNIQSEPVISEQLTLLSRGGSSVSFGNIQLIPVGESIVYIQPIFVQRSGAQGFPQFTFVAVFTEGKDAVIASTVQKGLNQLFDLEPTTPETPETPETPDQTDQTPSDLLAQAAEKFAEADAALKAGNLGEYQELVGDAQDLVDQALELLNAAGSGDSTTDSSTTTSTTGPPAEAPFTSSEAQAALGP